MTSKLNVCLYRSSINAEEKGGDLWYMDIMISIDTRRYPTIFVFLCVCKLGENLTYSFSLSLLSLS